MYDHGRPRARIAEVSQFNVASVFLKCPRWRSEKDSSLIHDQTWRSKSALPEFNDWIWSTFSISIALFCQAGPISCTECRIAMTSLQGPQNDQGQEETGQACHFASKKIGSIGHRWAGHFSQIQPNSTIRLRGMSMFDPDLLMSPNDSIHLFSPAVWT